MPRVSNIIINSKFYVGMAFIEIRCMGFLLWLNYYESAVEDEYAIICNYTLIDIKSI
jgi:hypothetical protein